jgi:hypothetical protein
MSWMDLSDYLVIEASAAARIEDLHDEAAAHAIAEVPAPAPPDFDRVRVSCEWLRSAAIEVR